MQIKTSRELIGIALIVPQSDLASTYARDKIQQQRFVFNPSELTKQHTLISTEDSSNTSPCCNKQQS